VSGGTDASPGHTTPAPGQSPPAVGAGSPGAPGRPNRWLDAALELDAWMAERDYAGHDPHDFLASPLVRAATLGSRWGAVGWTQLGKRLPVQIRPLIGVPRLRNAKGLGLVLAARVRISALAPGSGEVGELVEWLEGAAERGYGGVGWGYPFPWANRDFMVPAGTPSSVATAFVGHALLDAAEVSGVAAAGTLAAETAPFLTGGLRRIAGPGESFCFSYTPLDRRGVHNASLLAASLLARLGSADLARRATRFTLAAQRPDGSWPYGLTGRDQWVDSFHTGYVLLALEEIGRHVAVDGLDAAVERGLVYWRSSFFDGPAVGFHPGRPYPIDTHAVAQAILTFLGLRHRIPDAVVEAERLGDWALAEMRDPAGYYYYQHHGRWRNRIAYMRWTQAWMLRALAELSVQAPETR
jgi:hypothetical protein